MNCDSSSVTFLAPPPNLPTFDHTISHISSTPIQDGATLRGALICEGAHVMAGASVEPGAIVSFGVVVGAGHCVAGNKRLSLCKQVRRSQRTPDLMEEDTLEG